MPVEEVCVDGQQLFLETSASSSSGYACVVKQGERFQAKVSKGPGQGQQGLGTYDTAQEAAIVVAKFNRDKILPQVREVAPRGASRKRYRHMHSTSKRALQAHALNDSSHLLGCS